MKRNEQKALYDERRYNTKLLLRHYRMLNEYYHNAAFSVQSAEEADVDFADIMQAINGTMSKKELYVESIKQSRIRTAIIMAHVNKMLDIYKNRCENSGRPADARHWRVLEAIYISDVGMTAVEVAEKEHIDERTVYKDIDSCVADLTVLFFGISGIENGNDL